MISADFIECYSAESLNMDGSNFLCHTAQRVSSADSATWAAWAGVLLALFAVIFARKAWGAARDSNDIAEKNLAHARKALDAQLQETRTGLEKQMASMTELSRKEHQLDRLQIYLENLMRFAHSAATFKMREDGQSQFDYDKGELTISWGAWSAYLIGRDEELRSASSEMNTMFVSSAEEVQKVGKKIHTKNWGEKEFKSMIETIKRVSATQDQLFVAVGGYTAMMQAVAFQAEGYEALRQEVLGNAEIARKSNQRSK